MPFTSSLYLFFIFRGFKTTGPFVTMIYRMMANDLFRFVIIYGIFVMGFAQCKFRSLFFSLSKVITISLFLFAAYYIIFQSYRVEDDEENDVHVMPTPVESFLKVFIMSLGNFGDVWDSMEFTNHQTAGEVIKFSKSTLKSMPLQYM